MSVKRTLTMTAGLAALSLAAAACGGSGGFNGSGGSKPTSGKTTGVKLTMMIASSGNAETNAVDAATKAWGKKTGNTVQVIPSSNITQQLTQGMAGGSPPDVFYGETPMFQSLVKAGQLAVTGPSIANPSDFYPSLRKAFTVNNKFYCVPKDFSTLALEINTTMWKKAGLTNADLPTTWAKLASDAKKLTGHGVTGLVMSDTLDRVGAFMAEAGGGYMNAAGTKFEFNSPADLKGLEYIAGLAHQGVLKFPKQIGETWGGDSMGSGKAAMTVEGNWFIGGMKTTYPKLKYMVVPMPKGPTGHQGTLSFTNCWGVAAKSSNQAAAVSLINYLTTPAQQVTFANTIGVMPSRQSAKAQFVKDNPSQKAFIEEAPYAVPQISTIGFAQVQAQFDSQVAGLGSSSNPKAMLTQLQQNASALLNK